MKESMSHFIKTMTALPVFHVSMLSLEKVFHLHTIITSCGHDIVRSNTYSHNGLQRGDKSFGFLQYTLKGAGELRFRHTYYNLTSGTTLLGVVPQDHHYYLPCSSSNWEFVYIVFAGTEAMRLLNIIQKVKGPVFLLQSAESYNFFQEILNKAYTQSLHMCDFSSLAYAMLMSLLREQYPHTNEGYAYHKKIMHAINFCKQHYHQSIQIDTIARAIHMSRYHFSRLFHKEVGITVQKFLEEYRIQMSVNKIRNTNLPIKTIALKCGFSTSSYFSHVFKQYFDISPSLYRMQMKY